MKLPIAVVLLLTAIVSAAQADQAIQNVQQALKDQGFYYGEVTGEKDADTTAAIRRYQIRNGLQITGEVNDETLKSLGVDSSGAATTANATPPPPARSAAPETSDLRSESQESSTPTNPLTGQPFPAPQNRSGSAQLQRDEQAPAEPDYEAAPGRTGGHFAGTPYQNSSPQVQRDVIISAQNLLARRGLYRGPIDGNAGPELEFSLRAYQARVRLPVTGKLDLGTLAALQLLPGSKGPIYIPHRRSSREAPVRGEWVPER